MREDTQMTGSVIALNAFVVTLDVYVEVAGGDTFNTPLSFSPFNSKEEALAWIDEVEEVHAQRHSAEVVLAEEIFDANGLPTKPYLDTHLGFCIIEQSPLARKSRDSLLPPEKAKETEAKLGEHALRVHFARIGYACQLLDARPSVR